jgi:2-polyprenyl-3-methyl-5-hydroxy-6-metoxy-1,4-benzoquinol methylase
VTSLALAPVAKVDVNCVHCGAHENELLWTGREHEYADTTDEPFSFVRCLSCGVVRLNPRPDVSELNRIYPPGYYAYNLGSASHERPRFNDRLKKRMYQRRFESAVARLEKPGQIRVLDVGCADGRLLDWYRQGSAGNRLETHGIELNAAAAAIAQNHGHRVVVGRFETDTQLETGSFDLISAAHVIEHVDDPMRFARRAAELLAPGGLFVVATPNWNSVDARRFRGHWGGNHFPRHWTLYDEPSLRSLAAAVGLTLERVEYQPNPIFWVWSCHSWLRDRFPRHRWPDQLFPPVSIFKPTAQSFLLQSAFTLLDVVVRTFTGRTASIAVELRKPAEP